MINLKKKKKKRKKEEEEEEAKQSIFKIKSILLFTILIIELSLYKINIKRSQNNFTKMFSDQIHKLQYINI